jgi:hypothetical protein
MIPINFNRPISIKAVAEKLAAATNYEHPEVTAEISAEPRLVEVLLFIQHVSQPTNYAGGLTRFAADLIESSRDLIGTHEMHAEPADRPLTRKAVREIFVMLPDRAKRALCGDDSHGAELDFLSGGDVKEPTVAQQEMAMAKLDRRAFDELCASVAREALAHYLRMLCEEPQVRFSRYAGCSEYLAHVAPWYFPKVAEAVLRFIDRRKEKVQAAIADTEVKRTVFTWLDRARRMSWAVMVTGNSRHGKTHPLQAWCAMNPGVARLVNTPASNSEGDLLREVAKAIGLEIGANGGWSRLRDRIDYVLSHTRLMLVFDEAHFLFPMNFNRNTAPARLNWVRRSVMDAKLPCVFCATPQSYNTAERRFVKATGYALEQFLTRVKRVTLPEELSREDLMAVARIHFPKLADPYLEHVVSMTAATERNYFSDISEIAELAFCNAEDAGRKSPALADIKEAIAVVLPTRAPSAVAPPPPERIHAGRADRLQAVCNAPAEAGESLPPSRINFESEPVEHFIGED